MSLLDNPPHTVMVQLRTRTVDERGRPVVSPDGDPIPVRCMVEPARDWASAEETLTNGLQFLDLGVIRSRKWPGNIDSHVEFEGRIYETSGIPQSFSVSRRTRHYRITIKYLKEA